MVGVEVIAATIFVVTFHLVGARAFKGTNVRQTFFQTNEKAK